MKLHVFLLTSLLLTIVFNRFSLHGLHSEISPVEQPLPETNNKTRYTNLSARNTIYRLYRRLVAGATFEDIARQYSQDYGSYSGGGNLGWQRVNRFDPAFEHVITQLSKNQISEPFKTDFGYHIMQLIDRNESEVLTRHILLRVGKQRGHNSVEN